jgi:hypothetical protein
MTIENIKDINTKIIHQAQIAESDTDWAQIDQEIQSLTFLPDHNAIAKELLSYVTHEDYRVRDAVATSLTAISITDESILEEAINALSKIASDPNEDFSSAGRSAVFLSKYPNVKSTQSLDIFNQNVKKNNWFDLLVTNIPGIDKLLLVQNK